MRVALITGGLAPPFGLGGVSRYVYSLANELGRGGHEVVVYHSSGYESSGPKDAFETVKIETSRIPILRLFEFSRSLNQYLLRRDFHVIHFHIPILAWGVNTRSPIVVTVHTTMHGEALGIRRGGFHSLTDIARLVVFMTIGRASEYSVLNRARLVITVNPLIAEEILRNRIKGAHNILTMEPAMEPKKLECRDRSESRRILGIPDSEIVILYVGRLDSRKNPLVAVDGFSQALRKSELPLRLVVCGDGSLKGALESRVESLGLRNRIDVKGIVSDETLSLLYSAADMYLLPSVVEGFPATLLECRHFGVPAIVGPFPGAGRIVINEITGVVLKKVNEVELSDTISRLASHPSELARMAANARSMAVESNTWESISEELVSLYESLVDSSTERS